MEELENEKSEVSTFYSIAEIIKHTKFVWSFCSQIDRKFGIFFFLFKLFSSIKTIFNIVTTGFTIGVIANFSVNGFNSSSAWMAFGIYTAYRLFDVLLGVFEQSYVSQKKYELETQLQRSYLNKLLNVDIETLDKKNNKKEIIKNYLNSSLLFNHYATSFSFLSDVTVSIILLTIITYFAWPITLIIITLAIPRFLFDRILRKRFFLVKERHENIIDKTKELTELWLNSSFIHQIRVLKVGQLFDQKFLTYKNNYQKLISSNLRKWQTTNRLLTFTSSLGSLVGFAWVLFKNAKLSLVGSIYFQFQIINLVQEKLSKIISNLNYLEENCKSIIEIKEVYNWKNISQPSIDTKNDISTLEFKNINFFKPGLLKLPLLDNFQSLFKSGEKTTILVTDSISKELIFKLFIGGLKPISGEIIVDSQLISSIPSNIMVVSPSSYFPFLSIIENVSLKNYIEEGEEQKIIEILEKVGIYKTILNMPKQFKQALCELPAPVNQDFISLVLLARVIYHQPKWLFWISSSNTSPQIESIIFKSLSETIPTVITLTEKISSSLSSDRVVLIRKGKIIEQGSVAQLKELKGTYYLWLTKIITQSKSKIIKKKK